MKGREKGQRVRRLPLRCVVAVSLFLLVVAACSVPQNVTIEVDGKSRVIETEAETVRQVLSEAEVTLGDLDRVEPDLWESVEEGMEIHVIRVQEEREVEVEKIPFERRVVKNEALEVGKNRLMQRGKEGEEEVVYLLTYEDGQEVGRKEVDRRVVMEPVSEVQVVGAKGLLPSVPISGTIAYISYGNAWVMRHESGQKRPLTTSGDLDGRVFDLSPDGSHLLFTRALTSSLNSLWAVNTVVVGDAPQPLGIEGVRYAEWSSEGRYIAYSTAQRTEGAPGWKADNDLHILSWEEDTRREVLPPSGGGIYGWWGANFAWSPEGSLFAYADADEVGLIDAATGERTLLLRFPPFYTYGEWVWVPPLAWSPDGRFLATVIHELSPQERFALWVLGTDLEVRLAAQVGMWAAPVWSPGGLILFGQAEEPEGSQDSPYYLYIMDGDGSNERRLRGEIRVEELAPWVWSPFGGDVVVAQEDNLYLFDLAQGSWEKITADDGASHPRWAR